MISIPFRRRAADANNAQSVTDRICDLFQALVPFHRATIINVVRKRQDFSLDEVGQLANILHERVLTVFVQVTVMTRLSVLSKRTEKSLLYTKL
jgi:hypothetical protein